MISEEEIAKAIATAIGYEWDTLYASKADWIADRGSRHDINTPRKPDFIDAARAVLPLIGEECARIAETFGVVSVRGSLGGEREGDEAAAAIREATR